MQKVELDGCLAAEHRNHDLNLAAFLVDFADLAFEVLEWPIGDDDRRAVRALGEERTDRVLVPDLGDQQVVAGGEDEFVAIVIQLILECINLLIPRVKSTDSRKSVLKQNKPNWPKLS